MKNDEHSSIQEEINANDIRAVQQRIFKIFLEFEKVCLEHNLRFYLIAGTLLGAIRHKGFIPWDDDIDVAMPRKDYNILIENASKWFTFPYELDCREINKKYPLRFAKVHDANTTFYGNNSPNYVGGVYIDVFPYDGLPQNKIRQKLHLWKHNMINKLFYYSIRDPYKRGVRFDTYLLLFLQKIANPDWLYKTLKKITVKYDFETSNYVTDYDCGLGGIVKKEMLGDSPSKVFFEGHQTYGIKEWDSYLTMMYGDYMQLPPLEKRRPHHYHVCRDLNLPYRQYKIKKRRKD